MPRSACFSHTTFDGNCHNRVEMKSADPYECIRWKSSRGRLVVRTTWVKGVRHVILSDDDDLFIEKENRPRYRTVKASQQFSTVNTDEHIHECDGNDHTYVERVLRWLQTPSGMIDSFQKPMTAPDICARRPALMKTCLIPEDKLNEQQVVQSKKRSLSAGRKLKKNHKTELHVHLPPTCTSNEKIIDSDYI